MYLTHNIICLSSSCAAVSASGCNLVVYLTNLFLLTTRSLVSTSKLETANLSLLILHSALWCSLVWNSRFLSLLIVNHRLVLHFLIMCQDLRSEKSSRRPSSRCRRITGWRSWRGGGGREDSVLKRRITVPRVSCFSSLLMLWNVPSNSFLTLYRVQLMADIHPHVPVKGQPNNLVSQI